MDNNYTDTSDSDTCEPEIPRLGMCEVCNDTTAKYTCPKCEIKSCCLKCMNIHKKELSCNGIRDRTKYIPANKLDKVDMMNDYYFLEECTRFVNDKKRDITKKFTTYNKILPSCLFKLRTAAADRKITLRFLLDNFTKRQKNTSYLDYSTKTIYWKIVWCFPNAQNLSFTDEKCNEDEKLYVLLNKYLNPNSVTEIPKQKELEFYHSRGIGGVKVLLKSEGIKRCRNRFFELDCRKTIRENLQGKTIVEYPSIYVIFSDFQKEYDVVDSDEDIEAEAKMYERELDNLHRPPPAKITNSDFHKDLQQLAIEKKRDERRIKREVKEEPQNLIFSDESMWNELSSDGNETEEEEMTSPKRIKAEKE